MHPVYNIEYIYFFETRLFVDIFVRVHVKQRAVVRRSTDARFLNTRSLDIKIIFQSYYIYKIV